MKTSILPEDLDKEKKSMTDTKEIDAAIEAIGVLCPQKFDNAQFFMWVCAFKHMIRLDSKDPTLRDIKKTEHYLRMLRKMLEKRYADRSTTIEDQTGRRWEMVYPHAVVEYEDEDRKTGTVKFKDPITETRGCQSPSLLKKTKTPRPPEKD